MGRKPPGLGHGVQGRSGGLSPPLYKCTAYKGGSAGLAPGLGHGVQGGVRGACPLV